MRILVTGAGGFVGHHLLPTLLKAGHEVVAVSHRPLDAPGALGTAVFDISEIGRLRALIDQHEPNGVVHLAAQASVPRSWKDPAETYRANLIGTSNLFEALQDRYSTRVLLVGSGQQYGSVDLGRAFVESDPSRPESPYAISKAASEAVGVLYHREFGVPVIVARSFNHTGPGQRAEFAVGSFCSQIVEIERGRRPPRMEVGKLDSRRDFLDVRDVVEAYRLLIESGTPGEVYNVSSGEGVRVGDVLKLLIETAGLPREVEVIEKEEHRLGDPDFLAGDSSKLRAGLGWQPEISLERSLRDTLDWYRKHWN